MRMNIRLTHFTLIAALVLLAATGASAQVFWQDNFENATTPDIAAGSTRTAENNSGTGGPPFTSYFCRTPATATVAQSVPFTAFQNTNYWAGEDHDTPFGVGNEEQQIEWTNINIAGRSAIQFKGLLAANNTQGSWDNGVATGGTDPVGPTGNNDYIIIEYAIDAGAYTRLFLFIGDAGGPGAPFKTLREDTNGDNLGDGTQLTNVFTEVSKAIPGTGTTMKLRIRGRSNGGNEEWGLDNFRLQQTPTAANVTVSGRVMSANGAGVRNAIVQMTDQLGNVRTVRTGTFGFYRFDNVAAGESYVMSVASKQLNFAPRTVTVADELNGYDFIEEPR